MKVWIFNHLTYEFSLSLSTIYGIIFHASKVWITGCVFQPEIECEISYHYYKMFLVGKFHPLMIELSVYISCPKECFLQGIS
jgi:hypothetical protein